MNNFALFSVHVCSKVEESMKKSCLQQLEGRRELFPQSFSRGGGFKGALLEDTFHHTHTHLRNKYVEQRASRQARTGPGRRACQGGGDEDPWEAPGYKERLKQLLLWRDLNLGQYFTG